MLLVGGIGLLDVRLLGGFPALDMRSLAQALQPVAVAGFLLLMVSGVVLFAADAMALARSDIFRRKLILIGIALANALVFRLMFRRQLLFGAIRPAMRAMAGLSLLLWLSALVLGRWIAYA
ncbi:MAG: DUF6644 family protein [Sphingomonadaceae bacterium]